MRWVEESDRTVILIRKINNPRFVRAFGISFLICLLAMPLVTIPSTLLSARETNSLSSARSASSIYPLPGTPIVESDGRLVFPSSTSQNHWWLLDFWDSSPTGGNLPSDLSGQFVSVTNTIGGLQPGDGILYLPINVAYGTSSSNCVWFQFDVYFDPSGHASWYIWDINCPGTNLASWPSGDYHYTSLGLPYTVGDHYSFAVKTSGYNRVTFSINDTSTGSSWSKSDWVWTVPSTTLLATEGTFSPSSAVEGYTTASSLTGVPLFETKMGDGISTNRNYESGTGVPLGIATSRSSLGDFSHWMWSMSTSACGPVSGADNLNCNGLSPTTIGLNWGESGYLFFNRYEVQQSAAGANGPWTTLATITVKSQTTEYVFNLSPSTTYWWRVIDYDCCGASTTSNTLQITQRSVANLRFTQLTDTDYLFAWNNDADYTGPVSFDTYQLMESVNGASYSAAYTTTVVSGISYIAHISPDTGYSFYLVTTDKCGTCSSPGASSSNSNTVSFRTPPTLVATGTVKPGSVDVGQPVSFACYAAGGVPPYTYSWTFGDGVTSSGQILSHSYSSPGMMNVACTITDSLGSTALAPTIIIVSLDPTISVPVARPTSADLGQTVVFSTQANGGSGGYTYAWLNLPPGCKSADTPSISCQPSATGTFQVAASATDSNGFLVTSNPLSYTVNTDPAIAAFTASPTSLDLGQAFVLVVSASGGTGTLSYAYSGLPQGCTTSSSPALSCTPSSAGTYTVSVSATDTNGFIVVSSPLSVVVNPDPTITAFTASVSSIYLGDHTVLSVTASGGTGQLSYSYSGLPPGCPPAAAGTLSCTPTSSGDYVVGVTVTDQAGKTATSSVSISVGPSRVFGLPPAQGYSLIGGVVALIIVVGVAAAIFARRRGGARQTTQPSA